MPIHYPSLYLPVLPQYPLNLSRSTATSGRKRKLKVFQQPETRNENIVLLSQRIMSESPSSHQNYLRNESSFVLKRRRSILSSVPDENSGCDNCDRPDPSRRSSSALRRGSSPPAPRIARVFVPNNEKVITTEDGREKAVVSSSAWIVRSRRNSV